MSDFFSPLRAPMEKLYEGRCDIFAYQNTGGTVTHSQEVQLAADVPCRLSYKASANASQTEREAAVSQTIKLFLAPEIPIQPGAKIVVTQHGNKNTFVCGGKPAAYSSHQEVELILESRWC